MTRKFKLTISWIWLTVIASVAHGVEVQQGPVYEGGTLVESSSMGVAFTIPDNWKGQWPQGSTFFLLESPDYQATLFMTFEQMSEADLQTMMQQVIPLGEGINLSPLATPVKSGNVYQSRYDVSGAPEPMVGFIVGRALRKDMIAAIIAISTEHYEQLNTATSTLVKQIEVREPVAPPPSDAQTWLAYLKGRYIARYYTGSGYSEKKELWLCSDGSFSSSFDGGGYSMNGTSGAFAGGGQGRWEAQGSIDAPGVLILRYQDGSVSQYRVELADKLYLDGVQWLRGDNERCY